MSEKAFGVRSASRAEARSRCDTRAKGCTPLISRSGWSDRGDRQERGRDPCRDRDEDHRRADMIPARYGRERRTP